MSNVDRCCLNCAYLKTGLCCLFEIVPNPPDKMDCASFIPKVNRISEVTENKKIIKQTVFDHITQNVETLAEKLVYEKAVKVNAPIYEDYSITIGVRTVIRNVWSSALTEDTYTNRAEAVAGTIEELKKEYKG